jgi:hypothetical protein
MECTYRIRKYVHLHLHREFIDRSLFDARVVIGEIIDSLSGCKIAIYRLFVVRCCLIRRKIDRFVETS